MRWPFADTARATGLRNLDNKQGCCNREDAAALAVGGKILISGIHLRGDGSIVSRLYSASITVELTMENRASRLSLEMGV